MDVTKIDAPAPQDALKTERLRQFGLLYLLIALFTVVVVVVVGNNPSVTVPVFLFLFLTAVGVSLTSRFRWSLLVVMIALIIWISVKRSIGVWTEERLLSNGVEIITALLTILLSSLYRRQQNELWATLQESKQQLTQLDLEDRSVGLLHRSVGLLRVEEESERALAHRRPFAVLLIKVQAAANIHWDTELRQGAVQAVGLQIKDVARQSDVPFLLADEEIALLMPETSVDDVLSVIRQLVDHLRIARYRKKDMRLAPLEDVAQVRYGFAAFMGSAGEDFDIIDIARRSLLRNIQDNEGAALQNLFVDWITIGTPPISSPVVGLEEEDGLFIR